MASKGTVAVKFVGDVANLTKSIGDADSKLAGFGKAAMLGVAAIGTAAAGAAVGLFKIGESFDEQYDKIRVGTGATGDALDELQGSFKNVLKNVPTDFESAGTAIADLNTRLGLTGKPLEDLSGQFINLARITGSDVTQSIDNITRVFGDWGTSVDDQAGTMDKLYRAAQSSGIGIDDLSTSLVQFGAPLRNLGFGIDESMALLAQFNKTGVNTETVFAGLKAGVGKLAKAGEPVPETFKRIVGEITKMGPGTEATALAIELFGQRAGPDLADAIAGGKFELDGMLAAITGGKDTINGAAADTASFSEKWQVFKNRVLVGLEPLAKRVFDGLGTALDGLSAWWDTNGATIIDHATRMRESIAAVVDEALARLSEWWQAHGPTVIATAEALGTALVAMKDTILTAIGFVIEHWDKFKGAIAAGVAIMIPHWVALGVAAIVSSAKQVQAWVVAHAKAAWAVVQHSAHVVAMVAGWALTGAKAMFHAGQVVAGWAMTAAGAVANVAVHVAQVGVAVAKWVFLGAQSLLHAGKVAAAWVISMGPIGLVIAAVAGLVTAVVKNWDTITATVSTGVQKIGGFLDTAVGFFASLPGRIMGAVGDMGSLLYNAGARVIQGFIDGIKDKIGSVKSTLGGITSKLTSWKGPPSRDAEILRGAGHKVLGGFVEGLKDMVPAVKDTLGGITYDLPGMAMAGSPRRSARADGGGGTVVNNHFNLHVEGSVLTVDDLVETLRRKLLDTQRRNPGLGFT